MGIIHLALSFSDSMELNPNGILHIIYYSLPQLILFCYSGTKRD